VECRCLGREREEENKIAATDPNLSKYSLTDDAEIFLETMANEDTAQIYEKSQLLVGDLQRHQGVRRGLRFEVAICGESCEERVSI